MSANALFKKRAEWPASPERGYPDSRRLIYLLLVDTGDDLRVEASDAAWEAAGNLRTLQQVTADLSIIRVFKESNAILRADRIVPAQKGSA